MKLLVLVVLAVVGASNAARPGAIEVIDTFKQIVPRYLATLDADQEQIFTLEREGTDAIAEFHSDIALAKQTFVMSITLQEDQLIDMIGAQNTSVADEQCMQFIATAANETVNVIGVGYTQCINAADEALGEVVLSYYGSIGALEQTATNVTLLDVFRGENVFYTPDNIVAKLRQKETDLRGNSSPLAEKLQVQKDGLVANLTTIRNSYIGCMTDTEIAFRNYISLAQMQLSMICGGEVNITRELSESESEQS
ncbi:uncharacterized protein LOC118513972 [Anopheles stephensi]|uniref:uncharacterized protein LOC118513972 n=1 Tax=Anopheles stephensi TaxID=30069 RepID=UPI00165879A3|nr:uncharacterized protein LOC118513972 [Anopheles stephensi]